MSNLPESTLSRNRGCYIIEAALEYFISILITDSFLALLLTRSGVSDAGAGIITELASFAFSAQLVSVFFKKTQGLKRFVTILHIINQLMFVMLYMIPIFPVSGAVKTALFVVMFLSGQIIANIVSPYKLPWLMSYVPDNKRGRFTANKEIVSLAGGMTFSYIMGSISDHYQHIGKGDVGFLICGVTIFVLAVLHTISLLLVKEEKHESAQIPHIRFADAFRGVFKNKTLLKLMLLEIMWHFASKLSIAFYGVYKTGDLGFSMRYIAILSILSSLSRIAFSRLFGTLGDKRSWAWLLKLCFAIAAFSFFINIFTTPSNGKFMFAAYSCIHAISMAGINGGLMNVIFDYVSPEERPSALGVITAVAGMSGFAASLVGSVILSYVQAAGNSLFGIPVYGQQVLSAITFVLCVILVIYVSSVIGKIKKQSIK